jgi:uncharacterized protein YllA (UPF0747 family)
MDQQAAGEGGGLGTGESVNFGIQSFSNFEIINEAVETTNFKELTNTLLKTYNDTVNHIIKKAKDIIKPDQPGAKINQEQIMKDIQTVASTSTATKHTDSVSKIIKKIADFTDTDDDHAKLRKVRDAAGLTSTDAPL